MVHIENGIQDDLSKNMKNGSKHQSENERKKMERGRGRGEVHVSTLRQSSGDLVRTM